MLYGDYDERGLCGTWVESDISDDILDKNELYYFDDMVMSKAELLERISEDDDPEEYAVSFEEYCEKLNDRDRFLKETYEEFRGSK